MRDFTLQNKIFFELNLKINIILLYNNPMNKILNAKLNEDTNLLKLVALITMLTDHIGLVFFKDIQIFRMIGRLSFPLFAYSTFIGYYKTNNLKKYILRLLIIGIITLTILNKVPVIKFI